jgi:hypothetical protein
LIALLHVRVKFARRSWAPLGPTKTRPYDLLVLDGGGQGKSGERPADLHRLLRPGGMLVIDDLTPARHWPPRFDGAVDQARMHWLDHPGLDAAELRLAPDLAALVATRRFAETSSTGHADTDVSRPPQ